MRAKDHARLAIIRGIKAAILAAETRAERITLDDDGILQVIAKEVKERKDTIPEFERGGRSDLVQKAQEEINILSEYLPTPLTEDQMQIMVVQAAEDVGAQGPRDMGRVMGILASKIRGRADGRVVSEMVKNYLQGL